MPDMARRGIFGSLTSIAKKNKKENIEIVYLPYNKNRELFHQECPKCEEKPCVVVCEEEIIKINNDGIPYLSFSKSGCTFCEECLNACPNEVLELEDDTLDEIDVNVKINVDKCLAWNEVVCSTCRDVCDERAIDFFGMMRPTINEDKCTGCGFCFGVCPPYAIEISARKGE